MAPFVQARQQLCRIISAAAQAAEDTYLGSGVRIFQKSSPPEKSELQCMDVYSDCRNLKETGGNLKVYSSLFEICWNCIENHEKNHCCADFVCRSCLVRCLATGRRSGARLPAPRPWCHRAERRLQFSGARAAKLHPARLEASRGRDERRERRKTEKGEWR